MITDSSANERSALLELLEDLSIETAQELDRTIGSDEEKVRDCDSKRDSWLHHYIVVETTRRIV